MVNIPILSTLSQIALARHFLEATPLKVALLLMMIHQRMTHTCSLLISNTVPTPIPMPQRCRSARMMQWATMPLMTMPHHLLQWSLLCCSVHLWWVWCRFLSRNWKLDAWLWSQMSWGAVPGRVYDSVYTVKLLSLLFCY